MSKSTRRRSMARDRARLQQVGGEWTPGISDEARAAEGWRALDIGGGPGYHQSSESLPAMDLAPARGG